MAVVRRGHHGTRIPTLDCSASPAPCCSAPWGTSDRVLLLGCIPLGAWGVPRSLRPLVSPRARVVAVISYLGLPLPYGALGLGRWDGLVAYAAFPFIALGLAGRRAWRRTP